MSRTAKRPPKPAPVRAPVPPTPRPADAPPQVQGTLPPSQVRPSPTNPRETFPEEGLRQLAASFAEHGVLQPILVRPMGERARWTGTGWEDLDHFEVVAGERRLRAARMAGLAGIPAVIRWLTDTEALTIQLIENDQREDVLPSEQAAAYARLVAVGKTVEEVAEATGQTTSFVRSVLSLAKLPAWALEAVDAGDLPRRTAELAARIPGERSREECLAFVLCDDSPPEKARADLAAWVEKNRCEPCLPYREVEDLIRREFQVELKQAKFSRKALDLVEGAGSCEACPKRAGNHAEAKAAGTRADVCLDPHCFRAKTEAHNKQAVQLAKSLGAKVLSGKESDKLFPSYSNHLSYNSDYVDFGAKCYEDLQTRTYKALLEKHVEQDQIVIATDRDGQPHTLVKKDIAKKILLDEHKIGAKRPSPAADESWRREQKKRAEKAALYKAAAQKAAGLVEAKVREAMEDSLGLVPLLQRIAAALADAAGSDACRMVSRRRGLEKVGLKHNSKYEDTRAPVEDLARKLDGSPELLGLIAELVAAHQAENWCFSYYSGRMDKDEAAWWKAFGVDRDQLLAEAKTEKTGKAQSGKGKPAGSKKPKEKAQGKPTVGAVGKCRVCGCTEANCQICVERTGEPCTWTSEKQDLCSACLPFLEQDFGALFVGRDGLPDRGRVTKLQAVGTRTIGHIQALDPKAPPRGLKTADVEDLQRAAKRWLNDQLAEIREMLKEMPPASAPEKPAKEKKASKKEPPSAAVIQEQANRESNPVVKGRLEKMVADLSRPPATQPVGDVPLRMLDGMPASIWQALEKRVDSVKTLSDLEKHVTRNGSTILANLPTHQVVYETITRLVGHDGFLATMARDAVMKHTQPGWTPPGEPQPRKEKP